MRRKSLRYMVMQQFAQGKGELICPNVTPIVGDKVMIKVPGKVSFNVHAGRSPAAPESRLPYGQGEAN